METRARYVVIGLFIVAVTFVGFAFVYWMESAGGLGPRASFRVRFDSPVTGLGRGSFVLFNGVRVGEVTGLRLDRQAPARLEAIIAIDPVAPVRADTRVSVEFQGLTGAPAILLTGGGPGAAPLQGQGSEPPLLIADAASGLSVMQAGRQALQRLDKVLADNSDALHGTLTSLNTFSDALSRNSERVDGIFAGLERLTGGARKGPVRIYELTALKEPPPGTKTPSGLLVVAEPTALMALASDKIQARPEIDGKSALEDVQWSDELTKVVQDKVIQSFENAGFGQSVAPPVEGVTPDYQLLLNIRAFHISAESGLSAQVELSARIVSDSGRIVGSRVFRQTVPAPSAEGPAAAAALDEAFGRTLTELAPWTSELAGRPATDKGRKG